MQDDLGSVMGITDSNSNVIDEYMYDEFGEELDNISHIQTITYTGYQKEAVGDTYFAQARQYNPVHGRFMSEDIIKGDRMMPVSLNTYVYCWNRPEVFVDLDGRTACNAGITRVVETYLDDSTYKLPEEYTLGDAAKNYVYNGDGKIGTSGLALDTASEGVEHTIKYSTPKVLDSNVGSSFSKLGGKANVAFAIGGGVVDGYNEIEESLANGESADEAIINGTVETGFSIGTSLAAGALGAEFGAAVGTIFPGIGNIIGAVVGFVLGIAFSIVFDYLLNIEIYDGKNIKDLTKDLVKDIWSGYKKQLYEKQVMINNLYGISCDCPIMEEIYE